MGIKIENNSTKTINGIILSILTTKTKTEANKLLKAYGLKIVSSTKKDDTKIIVIENI